MDRRFASAENGVSEFSGNQKGLICYPNSRSVSHRSRIVNLSLAVVDEELRKGNERAALALVKDLQGKPGGLRCFGTARQIPQRLYSLDELKLNGIVTTSLLSPVDSTLGSMERNLQLSALLGGLAAWNVFELSTQQIFFLSLGLLFLWTLDAVSLGRIYLSSLNL